MKRLILAVLFLLSGIPAIVYSQVAVQAPVDVQKFFIRIYFTDKGNDSYVYTTVVSQRSIQRRLKVRTPQTVVDYTDMPVVQDYVDQIVGSGVTIHQRSRWLNEVSGFATQEQIDAVIGMSFVRSVEVLGALTFDPFASGPAMKPITLSSRRPVAMRPDSASYGPSYQQLQMMDVLAVHETGNHGEGILIGVFDDGVNLLEHEIFASMDIVAMRDFVEYKEDVAPSSRGLSVGSHGVMTLSLIGGYAPGNLIGPAYGASFVLARTEDTRRETPLEVDNWIAAIEWADSIGIDIATTSLTYRDFNDPFEDWTYENMDGNTAIITRVADMAASKGILLFNAAGNDGWKVPNSLSAPADGDSVLAVGALRPDSMRASFSSVGQLKGGPVKPEIMAPGDGVYVAVPSNISSYDRGSGTSFASPLAAGVAALVMHEFPILPPMEIAEALKMTGNNVAHPENRYGFGLINAVAAIEYLRQKHLIP